MSKCPICDIPKIESLNHDIDYNTMMLFCPSHLTLCDDAYRYKVFGNSNALSVWLRVIADVRDIYLAKVAKATHNETMQTYKANLTDNIHYHVAMTPCDNGSIIHSAKPGVNAKPIQSALYSDLACSLIDTLLVSHKPFNL